MRVASWNVNSVKVRCSRIVRWLATYKPDVLCLQELKGIEENFPHTEIKAAGYCSAVYGQKTYNGVAILTREKSVAIQRGFDNNQGGDASDAQARLISVLVGDITYICVYVPNGQAVGSDKFEYKLWWFEQLKGYLERHHIPTEKIILCGDFNCAPDDRDVHRVDSWKKSVFCHESIRGHVRDLLDWGFTDTLRQHTAEGGLYSWWDYRHLGFPKNNGLRIDLLLATSSLSARCTKAWIDRDERKSDRPSDHVPVVADFS